MRERVKLIVDGFFYSYARAAARAGLRFWWADTAAVGGASVSAVCATPFFL